MWLKGLSYILIHTYCYLLADTIRPFVRICLLIRTYTFSYVNFCNGSGSESAISHAFDLASGSTVGATCSKVTI